MSEPASDTIDVDYLRTWIGREDTAMDTVSADLIRKFNATFDIAAEAPRNGDLAPPLVHYCIAQPAAPTGSLAADGHPEKGGFLPPVPLPKRMWAGSRLRFHEDLRVGEEVRRVSRIADVVVKEGRSGRLCFVTVEHQFDVAGTVKIEETQEIVYRDAAPLPHRSKTDAPANAAPVGTHSRRLPLSSPLLFRYSALTFNGHRIHYDRPYATEVEGYPGLVVHGPLQATLLLQLATQLKGKAPRRFSFRGVSPLFDRDRVHLNANNEDSGVMKLWTSRENGPVGMTAEAIW